MPESIFPTVPATTAQPVHDVRRTGRSPAIGASPSPSKPAAALSTTAGTADGKARSRAKITAEGIAYAKSRGLSESTLEAMRVGSATAHFQTGDRHALYFPHYDDKGGVRGWKARACGEKDFTAMPKGKFGLWNVDQVLGSEVVYITEGEIDACSLVEAGYSAKEVVSVPHGARPQESENPERGYSYVADALAAGLSKAEKFVLVTDNDEPGQALRADLVRILGAARCFFVDFPAGIKDANDYLVQHGGLSLRGFIDGYHKPWPIKGLYRLSELPKRPPLQLWYCGWPTWQKKLHFAPRALSVVTGFPGHGKTILLANVWANIAKLYGIGIAVASFETEPNPDHQRALRQHYWRRLEHTLNEEECAEADKWTDEHFLWLVHEEARPSLTWALDLAEAAVIRHGAKVLQIDPWNKLESGRPENMKETDYIGSCLDELMRFAKDMNVHVQVLAHPAKPDSRDKGKAPMLEDISGSMHWFNKVDFGVVIHRPKLFDKDGKRLTEVDVFVRKSRHEELGHPCRLPMKLNLNTGLFEERADDRGGEDAE